MCVLLFAGFAFSMSHVCGLCVNRIERALELSRQGLPLEDVNQTMLTECNQLNFMMSMGCKMYVKKHLAELYRVANKTDLSPRDICRRYQACPEEELM